MQEKLVLTASVKGRKNSLSYYSTFIGKRDITIEKIERSKREDLEKHYWLKTSYLIRNINKVSFLFELLIPLKLVAFTPAIS